MNTLRPVARSLVLLALGASASAPALSHEAGDFFIRLGPALVAPNDDSGTVVVNGAPVGGTGVDVDDGYALGITFNYMLAEHWGIELLASTPFTHDIGGEGLGIADIGEVTHLPPTLSIQYYPLPATARVQPYVGLGVNYFLSYDAEVSSELEAALGNSSIDVDDSVGLAGQLGVDFRVGEKWSLNAALWYINVETEAAINTPTAGFENINVDVDVNPFAWMLGATYEF
ncbi:MAG: OmpW family outer membrane protein [Pseudomonadales bacterium]|jgi:outer membrane protein|nr:OmpW family outer membrane protein [Pseudomonadales bacterium]